LDGSFEHPHLSVQTTGEPTERYKCQSQIHNLSRRVALDGVMDKCTTLQ